MFHILASLFFAGAGATAALVMALTLAAYKDKMIAALRMQPFHARNAPWRTQPRHPARTAPARIVRQIRLSRAAA